MTPRRSKYGAKKVTVDGIKFDSKLEAARWLQLNTLQRAGQISGLKRQVKIELIGRDGPILTPTGRKMKYVADFQYMENGILVTEDAKGFPTPEYKIKKAIIAAMGISILET